MSIDGKRTTAAAGFIALLALSVFWPEPVLDVNALCCQAPLPIDELSFLGREAPSWDVAFWFLAGLFVLAMLQSAEWRGRDFREGWTVLRSARLRKSEAYVALVSLLVSIAVVALTWRYADAPAIAWAEAVDSPRLETIIRIFNRFGGGMNPAMVVGFFLIGGVIYRRHAWVRYAVAMALAGAAAGLFAQIVKYVAGRARPELWLGPFTHARTSATSFPSGHTVGAFALGMVLATRSDNVALRVAAIALAASVAVSRVLAFRHWPSDVIASALIGATFGWVAGRAVHGRAD